MNDTNLTLFDVYKQGDFYTDKYDLGYLQFFYNSYLQEYKPKVNAFLEIGVSLGGSMKLWRNFFESDVEIVGVDVREPLTIDGCKIIQADAYSRDFVDSIPDEHFDLIVDDGPHTYESWMSLIDLYYDKVPKGGRIIIEDVIPPFEMGRGADDMQKKSMMDAIFSRGFSEVKIHDMTGKQQTERLTDLWKIGIEIWEIVK